MSKIQIKSRTIKSVYHKEFDKINKKLFDLLPEDQKETVFNSDYCDIEPSFLGFVDTYYYLSLMIPQHYTIIDLGAAYNAQCFFFSGHKRYIAVDLDISKENAFYTENCDLVKSSIQKYVLDWSGDIKTTFAICNYVPDDEARELASKTFENCYCFYPA